MARKRKNWLEWEEAKRVVQAEMIPSRNKYYAWHKREQPGQLPARPYRVYQKEWVGWNDWLGTDNKFSGSGVRQKYWTYSEAVAFVHKLGIKSRTHWLEYCKGEIPSLPGKPDGIPARVELTYAKEWVSFSHFFGNKAKQRLEAKQKLESIAVLVVMHIPDHPGNCFVFRVHKGGLSAVRDAEEAGGKFKLVRAYRWEKGYDISDVLTNCGASPFYQYSEKDEYMCPNIHEVLWQLMDDMDIIPLI